MLLFFLACYYALSGRRSVAEFLRPPERAPRGGPRARRVLIGLAGWLLTIVTAMASSSASGTSWRTASARESEGGARSRRRSSGSCRARSASSSLIVVSAMVVEELFFRSFLQTRVGPVAATLMFTAAHGAYGQPLMLIGILVISTVLSITFARYRNVLPCIVAHGVFDAIQMFVVIPWYLHQLQAS